MKVSHPAPMEHYIYQSTSRRFGFRFTYTWRGEASFRCRVTLKNGTEEEHTQFMDPGASLTPCDEAMARAINGDAQNALEATRCREVTMFEWKSWNVEARKHNRDRSNYYHRTFVLDAPNKDVAALLFKRARPSMEISSVSAWNSRDSIPSHPLSPPSPGPFSVLRTTDRADAYDMRLVTRALADENMTSAMVLIDVGDAFDWLEDPIKVSNLNRRPQARAYMTPDDVRRLLSLGWPALNDAVEAEIKAIDSKVERAPFG